MLQHNTILRRCSEGACHGHCERFSSCGTRTARCGVRRSSAAVVDRPSAWYAASFVLHMVMACALMLVSVQMKHRTGDVPEILERSRSPSQSKKCCSISRIRLA